MRSSAKPSPVETEYVHQREDAVNVTGRHHTPPLHPQFSLRNKRYSTAVPRSSQHPQQQPWSNAASLSFSLGTARGGDLVASMTTTNPDCCDVCDQSGAVEQYFASVRVPASFLAATSFTELFAASFNHDDTSIQRQLQIICLICQGISFALSMNVIVLSSQALVRALTGDFDPFAETGYEFLFREFHFEFVCVRWSFLVSLFGFLLAVTAKILYTFELFNVAADGFERNHLELGIAVCLVMASLMMHLASYVSSTMIGWKSMTDMTLDMMKMLISQGSNFDRPVESVSLLMAFIGIFFFVLALIPGAQI